MLKRQQAQAALQVSETRYRRLFETAQDGILILDANTGRITDVNPFLMKMLGYSHAELLGQEALGDRPVPRHCGRQDCFPGVAKYRLYPLRGLAA